MYLIYSPADGDVQKFEFKPALVSSADAEAVEDVTDMAWDEFTSALLKGRVKALRALLWMFQKKVHPVLQFRDVSFNLGEVTIELDREELEALRVEVEKVKADDTREQALAEIDKQLSELTDDPKAVPA